ncbi:LacI family DNA-binding transcriptional regulator [Terrimonas rubra]|uniref:LacI family DNA-binding transcriptional regulator n=1 Tax=Terrimonas rubra TaxID=1035890 RepID=A0ABW6AC36_9BACT
MIQKPATIKEIAKRLNVSISTVSRALHDHPGIGLRTKMRVQQIAAELNYVPNQAAISFKQGKTKTVGVILPNFNEDFFSIAITAIEDMTQSNGYTVLIGQSHDNTEREKTIVATMQKHRVDGVLVSLSKNTTDFTPFEQLMANGIPVVFFDRIPNQLDAYTVSCDLSKATEQLVDLLVAQKHKRIGFINGPESMASFKEREEGFRESVKKHKLSEKDITVVSTDLTKEQTTTAIKQLLDKKDRPTAVIAFNDYVALEAIKFTREQGLKINEDISFVSYANLPITTYLEQGLLASVEQFPYEQAEKATEILFTILDEKEDTSALQKNYVFQAEVVMH